MLDITTTATLRSEILEQTLASFKKNLFKDHPCRLIINIDPVGDDNIENVVQVARKYFGHVLLSCPKTPSFSNAFRWVFHQVESEYVFNLEDDWLLTQDINLFDMINIMCKYPKLASLRLPYRMSTDTSKNWATFFNFDTEKNIFMCPDDRRIADGFCGHPSLIRTSFIRQCLPYMRNGFNPEKEFHIGGPFQILYHVQNYDYGVYQKQNEPAYIQDIGRKWLLTTDWRKSGVKAFFNVWEKRTEPPVNRKNLRGETN